MDEHSKVVSSLWASNVRAIIDGVLLLGRNEILTYKQMADLIGKPVDGSTSEYQVAKERLARDHRVELRTIHRIGAQRLDDGGIVEELPRDRAGIQRRVRRSLRRAANVEKYAEMSTTQKHEYDTHLAHLGLMQHLDEPSVGRAIDERVQRGLTAPDIQRLIETLRS
jgi:hypothetical protein